MEATTLPGPISIVTNIFNGLLTSRSWPELCAVVKVLPTRTAASGISFREDPGLPPTQALPLLTGFIRANEEFTNGRGCVLGNLQETFYMREQHHQEPSATIP